MIENDFGEVKLPGGGIDSGEDDYKALVREVKEETGYDVILESIVPFGEIEEKLRKEDGIKLLNPEARSSTGWLLMDYGDVIVHIFNAEMREFYGLENLGADAQNVDISEIVTFASFISCFIVL